MAGEENTLTPAKTGRDVAGIGGGPRQDFTYRRLYGLRREGIDLGRSLFLGALIEDCVFESVDFSRCDLSGAKIVRCRFEDCRFSFADIRSCWFAESRLSRCDLQTVQFSRTECRNTAFVSCSFENSSLLENRFVDCEIAACRFDRASVTYSDFNRCGFANTGLAHCTALFLFFANCRFENFTLNAESIGLTFGLRRDDLDRIEFVHLGEDQPKPAGAKMVEVLATSYRARRWFIGAATLDLNFDLRPVVVSIRDLSLELSGLAQRGLPCDLDELDFFTRVLDRLMADGRLPLLAVRAFGCVLRDVLATHMLERDERSSRLLRQVDEMLLSLLDEACAFVQLDGAHGAVEVEFYLTQRPKRPLDAICLDVVHAVDGPEATLEFVCGHEGSWIEVWQTIPSVLATVQLVFLAVNGVLKELNKSVDNAARLKKKIKRAKPPTAKKAVTKRTKQPRALVAPSDDITAKVIATRRRATLLTDLALARVETTLSAIEMKPDEDLADFRAYSADNVVAITVRPVRKTATRASRKRAPAA